MIVIDRRNFFTNLKWIIISIFDSFPDLPQDGEVCYIEPDGGTRFFKDGLLHRDGDLPAIISSDKSISYWKNGNLHREDNKPAVIDKNGFKKYYYNGKLHRTNGKCCQYKIRKYRILFSSVNHMTLKIIMTICLKKKKINYGQDFVNYKYLVKGKNV